MSRRRHLPICDLLFSLVSILILHSTSLLLLIGAHHLHKYTTISIYLIAPIPIAILLASVQVNIASFVYYIRNKTAKTLTDDESRPVNTSVHHNLALILLLHISQLGLIWRYLVFFQRKDWKIDTVRKKMRELCILRQIHTIVGCLPGACILLYVQSKYYITNPEPILLSGCVLAILDLAWSLSCIGRTQYTQKHDFTLCWPSILCQFVWRSCTLSCRLLALVLFTVHYHYVTAIVIILHSIVTLFYLTLFSPITKTDNQSLFMQVMSYLCTCTWLTIWYFSFDDAKRSKRYRRMTAYYSFALMENSLLTLLWIWNTKSEGTDQPWYFYHVIAVQWILFPVGMLAAIIFYKYLHITKLMKTIARNQPTKLQQEININGAFQCQLPSALRKKPSQFCANTVYGQDNQSIILPPTNNTSTFIAGRLSVRAVKSRRGGHAHYRQRSQSEDRIKAIQPRQTVELMKKINKSQDNMLMETIF